MVLITDNSSDFWRHIFAIVDMQGGTECLACPALSHTCFLPLHPSLFALTLCYDYRGLLTVWFTIYFHQNHPKCLPKMLIPWLPKPHELEFWGERLSNLHLNQTLR